MRLPNGYWTKENILKEAKKYKYASDWETNSGSSVTIALREGWYKEASKHMTIRKIPTYQHNPLFLKGLKKCPKCKKIKKLNLFYNKKSTKDKKHSRCKKCSEKYRNRTKENKRASILRKENPLKLREMHLKRNYGLTIESFSKLLKKQNNSCKICKTHKSKINKNISVDHCHKTGKVRGLLCDKCNRGLGHFNDSPQLLKIAIKYLEKSS